MMLIKVVGPSQLRISIWSLHRKTHMLITK